MKLFDDDPLATQPQLLVDGITCPKELAFRCAEYGQPGHTATRDRSLLGQRMFVWFDDTQAVAPAAT
ncbi:hypothetical protein [Streptomyces sp. NPDC058371]|uniref:hypothetical protein n=1 Tax=Streptomyces sp. NPDC058371 TaxID=3346463 RepID=UPI0036659A02